MIKLLLIEDERTLAEIIRDTLNNNGFEVTLAYNGVEGLECYKKNPPDIIVTDIMMPHLDGFTFVDRLRKSGCRLPVLFLSARSGAEDVVRGFELGGNDYLRKPFAISELIVRIKALLNRDATSGNPLRSPEQHRWKIGKYTFDHQKARLYLGEGENYQELSTRESDVLLFLCRNKGQVVENKIILQALWGDDTFFNSRSLHVYITKLRHKLAADPSVSILNIRGVGYRLCAGWVSD